MGCKVILMLFVFVAAISANKINDVCMTNQDELIRNVYNQQTSLERETKALAQQMAKNHQEQMVMTGELISLVRRAIYSKDSGACSEYQELTGDKKAFKILKTNQGYFYFNSTQVTSLIAEDFCDFLESKMVAIDSPQLMQELNNAFVKAGTGNLGYWVASVKMVTLQAENKLHRCMFAIAGQSGVAAAHCVTPPKSILCKMPQKVAECFLI